MIVTGIAFLIATLCAALMGYAIQRGATCLVAAMSEIVTAGTAKRLVALAEASLWVAGGLLIAQALGFAMALPDGFAITGWTIPGGVLLGIGAWLNRACVFGAIARLGSGEWAYVFTPVGFFAGILSVGTIAGPVAPTAVVGGMPVAAWWLAAAFALFAAWRIVRLAIAGDRTSHVWAPHQATIVIGITFTIMLLTVGAWAYTDLLTNLAHRMADNLGGPLVLFAALLGGATFGGWTAGLLSHRAPSVAAILRCLVGGLLMGLGSTLIPGSNDGLILIGLPLLWPYAWIAIGAMCVTIWLALLLEKRVAAR